MQPEPAIESPENQKKKIYWRNLRVGLYLVGALLLFLFAINLMVASLHNVGGDLADSVLLATSNPFNGLFIGLLITALLQSSSTTTSLVVAFVASGALSVQSAIPIVMGANIGTTITSTLVSLGFINRKKEFRRAVAAGTYHDFFNILTAVVLFPLEYYNGFLSGLSSRFAESFFVPAATPTAPGAMSFSFGFSPVTRFLIETIPSGLFLTLFSIGLLFGSILLFRRLVSNILQTGKPEVFGRFFFKNQLKSFGWGIITTAAIRSSTITTSVVVPLVAKKIVTLQEAAPFIMGANVGTTITAFIAVFFNATSTEALAIAFAHLFFNLIGVLLFFPIPALRRIPMVLADSIGQLTLRYRLAGLVYILSTFFFIPFMLIYFNQDTVENFKLTYQRGESRYSIHVRMNNRTQQGEWTYFRSDDPAFAEEPEVIFPVSGRNTTFFIGNRMLMFNRPGFCWDNERNKAEYQTCVSDILPSMIVGTTTFDSVYVFSETRRSAADSVKHRYYFAARERIMLQHEVDSAGEIRVVEKLVLFRQN